MGTWLWTTLFPCRSAPTLACQVAVNRVCRRKTCKNFSKSYPQKYPQVATACLWKTGATWRLAGILSHLRNGPVASLPSRRPVWGSTADRLRPVTRLGYPSRVCSITGAAIDRIAAAIDQLASDARGEGGEPRPGELAARVAELWLMVSALDPELARRKEHYTKPADGTPSS